MKPRIARALIVVTVFALLGVLLATARYVSETAKPLPPPPSAVRPGAGPGGQQSSHSAFPTVVAKPNIASIPWQRIFISDFRYFLAWALLAPGILYLARRAPLLGGRAARSVAFHLAVPIAASVPFFCFRVLLNVAFGARFPTWTVLSNIPWGRVFVLETASTVPVYWLLLGLGTMLRLTRDQGAQELREMELRRSLTAAQLDALKFKLQPHFLFNTLNAIASLAQAGDTDGASRVVERLGTLLRLSMETSGRQLVTLDEELALVDAYLAIEEVRFGDRLRIVRRITPETRHALVPNLILQPLVENALVHGLSRRLEAGLLEVAARREGRTLHIAIRDDGPGLPPGWDLDAHARAGLRNVNDRIHALYPGASAFRLENGATGGAVAVLSIPFADADTTAIAAESRTWIA